MTIWTFRATISPARPPSPGSPGSARPSSRRAPRRSEEHTSELQSQSNLVCRLLLEKKKNNSLNDCRFTWQLVNCQTATPLRSPPLTEHHPHPPRATLTRVRESTVASSINLRRLVCL